MKSFPPLSLEEHLLKHSRQEVILSELLFLLELLHSQPVLPGLVLVLQLEEKEPLRTREPLLKFQPQIVFQLAFVQALNYRRVPLQGYPRWTVFLS